MAAERFVWINGALTPESQAMISFRDLGLIYGDAVFDTARTFGGRLFRLDAHLDRLWESLAYVRIDPGLSRAQMKTATEDLVQQNLAVLREGEDFWVTQRVSAGRRALDGEPAPPRAATVVIECTPLPLRARARFFRDGIEAVVAHRPKIAPEALSPRAKTTNYLNMMLAQRETEAVHAGAWAIQRDRNGNLAEGAGSNLFIVKANRVLTPRADFVLPGVSREVVLEICRARNIPVAEADVSLQQAVTADEAFFTSTSLCICPLRSLNGIDYAAGAPGPVTKYLMAAFAEVAGFDFVAQYLRFLSGNAASPAL